MLKRSWGMKKVSLGLIVLLILTGAAVGNSSAGNQQAGESEQDNKTRQTSSERRLLSLEEAVDLAYIQNEDIKTVVQDVYLREQDLKKARYFADKIKDADNQAEKGEEMLGLLKQQLAATPEDSTMYGYLQQQIERIEGKLDKAAPYRIDNYDNAKVAYLYEKQAEAGLDLTKLGVQVAKQKIGLLVNKQYFDAVKYTKIAEAKKLSLERAKAQAEAAEASYKAGFRAKDDYLLAKAQLEMMTADSQKAELDKENALTELKATIGVDFSTDLVLTGFAKNQIQPNLTNDIEQGLKKRLEIRTAQAELEVAKLNFQLASSYLGPGTTDYEQARINVNKAEIELERQKSKVKKEIIQAHQSITNLTQMSSTVKSTVQLAKESASIAEYRYKAGFSLPSPVMKALNAEDLAGTTVEVLAAQEKLAEIEEKVIEIEYNSNLARVNYLVNIGANL